ncbi:MAG: GNAT family N-acetyltransferase [Acidobacteria bacterium]|nr:GNAT family N-acetyltransferase [Acidobacteriota bacterium]
MAEIRAATVKDAAQIAHVHVASWRSTYRGIVPDASLDGLDEAARTEDWRGWLGSAAIVFVAVEDGRVVGFVAGGSNREAEEAYDAELYTIYLLQEYQRRGIGAALLRTLAARMQREGFRGMVVWVLETEASVGFYLGSGAVRLREKEIEIGGRVLKITGFGWRELRAIGG